MMTTNKLTKTFASGSLAIGVLAGAVLTATSASATTRFPDRFDTKTWAQWTGGTPLRLTAPGFPDAIATYKGGTFVADLLDTVTFVKTGDEFEFIYSAIGGGFPINNNAGTLIYHVTFPTFVDGVAIDSDVTASGYGTVTKTTIPALPSPPGSLISLDGSSDPLTGFLGIPLTKALTITDTFAPTGNPGEGLTVLSNNFREAPHPRVPEPGTILGLLAVGGLGMVSRFKKQK